MTNPHAHRLPELVAEAKAAAANVEHVWDRAALDWPLTSESVVVEVGGYKGRWALQIAERYAPRLYVFEPQPWAAMTCKAALGDRAQVLNYGLGDRADLLPMGNWETDGCTFLQHGEHYGAVAEIGETFAALGITQIDLLLMNIEGYEYTLLPHMLDRGILPRRLMVQFHIFDDYGVGMGRLFDRLAVAGYRVLWTYGVVLTAWERDI
jgi:FkbM family methyltransferase